MTFEVIDCDERYAWALANGGAEAMPPTSMPGIGRFAYVEDGEGNIVGMITPLAEETV
jgi:predicted enzyme related to lactoylglutathione lyase